MLSKDEFKKCHAEWIKRRLNEANMTQKELAMKTGLSPSEVSRLIHGARVPNTYTTYMIRQVIQEEIDRQMITE